MSLPPLAVVTDAVWLAEELAAAEVARVRRMPPFLRQIPEPGERVWAPTDYLMRLRASGWDGPLEALGWDWLAAVAAGHRILTRREVVATSLGEAVHHGRPRFLKPAEAKLAALPARVYGPQDGPALAAALGRYGAGLRVLSQQVMPPLAQEHRVYAIDAVPAGSSCYLIRDAEGTETAWDGLDPQASRDDPGALSFAAAVLDRMPQAPGAVVLDVGRLPDGTWVLIEANPVFSSAPYHVDPAVVVRSILACQRGDPRWAWEPDPVLAAAAHRLH